jgi:diadenylate cyclase
VLILGFKIGFLDVGFLDIIDIILVSLLLYQVYKLMKGSVAVKIFGGFLSLYLIYLVVRAAQMELLSSILGQFMGVGIIAAIILFQQEIRKFLLLIGKSTTLNRDTFYKSLFIWRKSESDQFNITPIIDACKSMSGTATGALMVFSRDSELKFYVDSGDRINAEISSRLLLSIFNKYSPLHDGAVIIYNGKISAARCILPVSENDNLPAQYGLRHRAAIGMSEVTDTLIIVVSEETGQMSLARNGYIWHNLSALEIRRKINDYLFETGEEAPDGAIIPPELDEEEIDNPLISEAKASVKA